MRSVNYKISVSFSPEITVRVKTFRPIDIESVDNLIFWVTTRVWSPIIYKNDHRRGDNFYSACFLGFDIDNGLSLEQAKDLISDWEVDALIGTTPSHQKEKITDTGTVQPPCDRFRIIFPMSSECTDREQFEYNVQLYLKPLSGDGSCKDPARLFKPCTEIVHINNGLPLDWQIPPPKKKNNFAFNKLMAHREKRTIPGWIMRNVERGVPPGGGGKPGRHNACRDIGKALTLLGYEFSEIVDFICTGPLGVEIGRKNVEHQVEWGRKYAIRQFDGGGESEQAGT